MMARKCYIAVLEMDNQLQALNIEEWQVTLEPTEDLEEISLYDDCPDLITRIGTQADHLICKELALFLKNNQDVSTWSHKDMTGINSSVLVHKLNVSLNFPFVWQKKRVFTQERDKAIAEEVCKLLEADIIREVCYFDWLANEVMVKKANSKWRMCVDFTNLNRACPKGSYPLPQIKLLVDSMVGHQLLSFMDAFSSYNQIRLDETDQEKTFFITSQGLFCYKVMPFGLKNARETYQSLVNRMFV